MPLSKEDYKSYIRTLLKHYFPNQTLNKVGNTIDETEKLKSLSDNFNYPIEKTGGTNFTANPQEYLFFAPPNRVTLDKYNDPSIGGETLYNLFADKIKINPASSLDPLYTLVHEAQHRRDFTDKYRNYNTNDPNFKRIQQNVVNSFYDSGKDFRADPVERQAVSGQMEPNEIVAQLRSYESMLPAGMTLFQSPLGKQIFKNDEMKAWWLSRTTPKLSDVDY